MSGFKGKDFCLKTTLPVCEMPKYYHFFAKPFFVYI